MSDQLISLETCGYCPLCTVVHIAQICLHPEFNDDEDGDGRIFTEDEREAHNIPSWCPLRQSSLTIKLDSNEERNIS